MVDYVVGVLLHNNLELLRRIIRIIPNESEYLEKKIEALDIFLKGRFENYLGTYAVVKPIFTFDK